MNGISSVVDALVQRPTPAIPPGCGSMTARLRQLLREGPATAAELGRRSGLPARKVRTLFARDINLGYIRLIGRVYRISPDYSEMDSARVRGAIRLLQLRGYTVSPPEKS